MNVLEIYHRKAERYKELLFSERVSGTSCRSRCIALATVIPMDPPIRFRFCSEAVSYRHLFNSKGKPSHSSSAARSSEGAGEKRSMACSPETCPDSCVRPSEVKRGGGPPNFILALEEVYDRKSRRYAVRKSRYRQLDEATNREQIAAILTYIAKPPNSLPFR